MLSLSGESIGGRNPPHPFKCGGAWCGALVIVYCPPPPPFALVSGWAPPLELSNDFLFKTRYQVVQQHQEWKGHDKHKIGFLQDEKCITLAKFKDYARRFQNRVVRQVSACVLALGCVAVRRWHCLGGHMLHNRPLRQWGLEDEVGLGQGCIGKGGGGKPPPPSRAPCPCPVTVFLAANATSNGMYDCLFPSIPSLTLGRSGADVLISAIGCGCMALCTRAAVDCLVAPAVKLPMLELWGEASVEGSWKSQWRRRSPCAVQ